MAYPPSRPFLPPPPPLPPHTQMEEIINFLLKEGLLSHQFRRLQEWQDDCRTPSFVVKIVPNFCSGFESSLIKLFHMLNEPTFAYNKKIKACVNELQTWSSYFGARIVHKAIMEVHEFGKIGDKHAFLYSLNKVKREFDRLKNSFGHLLELAAIMGVTRQG